MRYLWQHIATIISDYKGSIPLSVFLKTYYKQQPKLGSRDRKVLGNMAYSYYRCAKGLPNIGSIGIKVTIKQCLSLCGHHYDWLNDVEDIDDFDMERIFPFDIPFSEGISQEEWLTSMLSQPALFIRVVGNMDKVISKLIAHEIPYTIMSDSGIGLPNTTDITKILPESDYVIQDASSQAVGNYFHPNKNEKWYDCCCGAGGKSLMLIAKEPDIALTVSDIRPTIIHNLKKRFLTYHYPTPQTFVTDIADQNKLKAALGNRKFNHIICDAPCSGSGTWARTPENVYFFDPASLTRFHKLQKNIAINVAPYLSHGGMMYYITCSVFAKENEAVVSEILKHTGLQLVESHIINGIGIKADSMFIAVFRR